VPATSTGTLPWPRRKQTMADHLIRTDLGTLSSPQAPGTTQPGDTITVVNYFSTKVYDVERIVDCRYARYAVCFSGRIGCTWIRLESGS